MALLNERLMHAFERALHNARREGSQWALGYAALQSPQGKIEITCAIDAQHLAFQISLPANPHDPATHEALEEILQLPF